MKSKLFDLEEDYEFILTLIDNLSEHTEIQISHFKGNILIVIYEDCLEILGEKFGELTFFTNGQFIDLLYDLEYNKFHLEILNESRKN